MSGSGFLSSAVESDSKLFTEMASVVVDSFVSPESPSGAAQPWLIAWVQVSFHGNIQGFPASPPLVGRVIHESVKLLICFELVL